MSISLLTLALLLPGLAAMPDRPLSQLEQEAFQRAAVQAGESVVRIETVGGFDKLGETMLNTGATTGVVVSADGDILSSEFNFVGEPSAIFVTLPDGQRRPAERVATDHVRKLVLLKVDAGGLTPMVPAERPPRPGQWAIAVGRTYDAAAANVSVGVVSALGRVWGLAIQTDAKVSPVNYGGVLADLSGRAVGVLVPLSGDGKRTADAVAGVEWYDSGIGFAIPAGDAIESARRLRDGEDLRAGLIGIGFEGSGLLDDAAQVARVHPLGPADRAGVKKGDEITAVGGQSIARRGDLTEVLTRLYAGDEVSLTVRTASETRDVRLTGVAELPVYEVPGLGLLVDADAGGRPIVRVAAGDSPFRAGDRIEAIDEAEIGTPAEISDRLGGRLVGETLAVAVRRGEEALSLAVELTRLPTDLPADIPADDRPAPDVIDGATVGRFDGEAREGALAYSGYAPLASGGGRAAGLLVWLGDGGASVLSRLRTHLEQRNVALVVPVPSDGSWGAADREGLAAVIDAVAAKVPLDRRRTAVFADAEAAVVAMALVEQDPPAVRGVVLRRPKLRQPPAPLEPGRRVFFGLVPIKDDRITGLIRKALEDGRHLLSEIADPDDDPAALVRWIDWMGRE